MDLRCRRFSVKMYVKMEELGRVGGNVPENFVCRSANEYIHNLMADRRTTDGYVPIFHVLCFTCNNHIVVTAHTLVCL